jgi:hypothetical protein
MQKSANDVNFMPTYCYEIDFEVLVSPIQIFYKNTHFEIRRPAALRVSEKR